MTNPKTTRRTVLAGAVAAGAITALPAAASNDAELHEIEISNFAFKPAELTVKPGDRIRWINRDRAPHDATAANGDWKTAVMRQNDKAEITVTANMSTNYICSVHPKMKARLMIDNG